MLTELKTIEELGAKTTRVKKCFEKNTFEKTSVVYLIKVIFVIEARNVPSKH